MGFLLIILLVVLVPAAVTFAIGWWAGRSLQRRNIRHGRGVEGHDFQGVLSGAWRDGFVAGRMRAAPKRGRAGVPVPTPAVRPVPASRGVPVESAPAAPGVWSTPGKIPGAAPVPGTGFDTPPRMAPAHQAPPAVASRAPAAQSAAPRGSAAGPGHAVPAGSKQESSERRVLRNINITLYAAALLLIAAASLSIGLAVPTAAKFTGLVVVTALFYAGGIIIHARSERLRPSATAFTGTGLALIPITGLAFHLLVVHDAQLAWLATSLVGTGAFVYAGGRLQSKVLAALALTFMVSTAWSSGAFLNQGLIWYFIVTMMLAAVSTVLAHRQPRWLDNIYLVAFQASHRYVVPVTLAAAIFAGAMFDSIEYIVLFTVATGYYAIAAATEAPEKRAVDFFAARVTATLALITVAVELGADVPETLSVAAVLLAAQAVLVSLFRALYGRLLERSSLPRVAPVAAAVFIRVELQVLGGLALVLAVLGNAGMIVVGPAPEPVVLWSAFNWALLLVMAGMAVVAFRERGHMAWFVLAAGLCALIEPSAHAPWRQAILLTSSVLATAVALRSLSGSNRAVMRIGLQAVLPLAVGAMAGWVASGYFPDSGGVFPPSSVVNSWLVERAATAGFALTWLANTVSAAVTLRSNPMRTGYGAASTIRALLLPVGVLAGLVASQLVDRLEASYQGTMAARDGGTAQWLWAQPDWSELLIWATLAAAVISAGLVLGWTRPQGSPKETGEGPSLDQVRPWAHIAGVLGVAGAVPLVELSSAGWAAEMVLGVGLVYAGLRSLCAGSSGVRGIYSLAAQACLILGTLQLLAYFDAGWHAGAAVFAVTLTAGQLARLYLGRPDRPWQGIAFRTVTGWFILAVLALLPFGYSASVAGEFLFLSGAGRSGVDQAALLVQLSMLALYGGIWWLRKDAAPLAANSRGRAWLALPVVAAIAGLAIVPSGAIQLRPAGWLPDPLWNRPAAVAFLLTAAALLLIAEYSVYRLTTGGAPRRWSKMPLAGTGNDVSARAVSAVSFIAAAAWVAPLGEPGWQAVILLFVAIGSAIYATTLGIAALVTGSALAIPAACYAAARQLAETGGAVEPQAWVFPASVALGAAMLYASAIATGRFHIRRPESGAAISTLTGRDGPGWAWAHSVVLSAGALIALAFAAMEANTHSVDWLSYAGCAALAVAAVAAVFEWPERWTESAAELAAVVVAMCLHRVWLLAAGPVDLFWQAQYWVVVIVLLVCFEYFRGRSRRGEWAAIAASALLSTSGLTTVILPDPWQSGWTLTAHAALLVFGLLANRRLFVVWGAAGIGLAVLWYLRGYTFLLLSLLAMGLIALAVWRLVRLRARSG